MNDEVLPSTGALMLATESDQYPRTVKRMIVNGMSANRTPASFGA